MDALRSVTGRLTKIILLITLSFTCWDANLQRVAQRALVPALKTIESPPNRHLLRVLEFQ
jgi:hypothetical protein